MVTSVLTSVSSFFDGLKKYPEGVGWLFKNPKYMFLLFLPTVIGLFLFSYGWSLIFSYHGEILEYLYPAKPENFFWLILFYIGQVFLYLGIAISMVLLLFLITNIIAAPIYDVVSVAVEKKIAPDQFEEISLLKSLLLIKEEIKKALFILVITVSLLFIPVINVLTFPVAAFFLAWDFFDYPLARRGFSFRQRLQYASKNLFALVGFGIWLSIPFVQFFLMPLAVSGGTMLGIKAIQSQSLKKDDT